MKLISQATLPTRRWRQCTVTLFANGRKNLSKKSECEALPPCPPRLRYKTQVPRGGCGREPGKAAGTTPRGLHLSRMSGLRTILSSTAMVAVLGVGYGMWSIIAPGEDRRKELLKVIQLSGFQCTKCPL